LTERHELSPYGGLVAEMAKARGTSVTHVRLPIRDVSVPKSPSVMREILDTIDSALESGGTAYVHCRGGIGRMARWWDATSCGEA